MPRLILSGIHAEGVYCPEKVVYKKERTSKGSAGPFIETLRKGSVESQYENGIRGNANFDSADPNGSKSEKFVREI